MNLNLRSVKEEINSPLAIQNTSSCSARGPTVEGTLFTIYSLPVILIFI